MPSSSLSDTARSALSITTMAVATPSSLPRLTKNMSTHRYMINLINGRNGRADLEGSSCRYKCLVNHDGIFDCASTYYSVSQATALALTSLSH